MLLQHGVILKELQAKSTKDYKIPELVGVSLHLLESCKLFRMTESPKIIPKEWSCLKVLQSGSLVRDG